MTLAPGTHLGPYEILAPIGAGGMGEIYRARDRKLDRDVAIKVLPASVANDPETLARFEREAKAVAALSHPNILAIHDFGEHAGVAYAVMELLEGETLRERLVAGPIREMQAVDYALQIARGLSAAHERGIVHRDLKPENVFVSRDGHVKILDFGLAKKVESTAPGEETSAPTGTSRTEPGTVMGTLGYMSPEQVRGLPVDHRSDIFSFGAVLYELLSGRRAFQKETASDTMAAILRDDPPEPTESGRKISPSLDNVVRHCLEKDRSNRFSSAREIVFALSQASSPTVTTAAPVPAARLGKRSLLIGGAVLAVVVVAVAVLFVLRQKPGSAGGAEAVRRVAVLPFENLGSPDDDYFADGIADEIRGKLTTLRGVEVIARASSTPYRKTTKTPDEVAEELDVSYLLTATVRQVKSGGTSRVLVRPELVHVSGSGAPTSKWQQSFDAALTDVFDVQSDIATRVAQALGVALQAGEEERLTEKPTRNVAAYDAFLRGEEAGGNLGVMDPASFRRALAFYEQAVAIDPGFAQAWAHLARATAALYGYGVPDPALADRARKAAERAVAMAPNQPEGHLALGDYERLIADDPERARQHYREAQRLAPGNADAASSVAVTESRLGRWEAGVDHLQEVERLDPRSLLSKRRLALGFLFMRRYPEARDSLVRGLALAPANLSLIEYDAMTHVAQGDLAGARAALRAAPAEVDRTALVAQMTRTWHLAWVLPEEQLELLLRLTPSAFDGDVGTWGLALAHAHSLRGDHAGARVHAAAARQAIEEQLRASPDHAQRRAALGVALAYLGRREEAIREGERAVAITPVAKDAYAGPPHQHQLARIYILVGEPEKALDRLEPLLKIPYVLSPGWLRIDPTFDPLRGNPRFQKLVAGAK
jgi:TolB-like protein/Flp pilus assembly protein TadD